MGQKIRPDSYRLGIIRDWNSRWFADKKFGPKLEEDELIREVINNKIKLAGIVRVEIERNANNAYRVMIKAAKPGLIIGRGGQGIEELTKAIQAALVELLITRGVKSPKVPLSLNIEELKRSEISAQFVGQSIAWEVEKRMPFRRTMKKAIENVMQNRDVLGIKVKMGGRLDGNEIARTEFLAKGKLPLGTLRANIDYGQATAFTTYGAVGIKVWIYKGLVFSKDLRAQETAKMPRSTK
jgi:small subunit ribosomal protein S3